MPKDSPVSPKPASGSKIDPKDLNKGHRKRLRERFLRNGGSALHDYELLELILFRAIPRRDIKDLAKTLLKTFGTFGDVINAPFGLLEKNGLSEAAIFELKLVTATATELSRERILNRPMISTSEALLDYCRAGMAYDTIEQFRILFLDRKNFIIADEVQQRGTVDHTPVYPREVVKRALELSASALILVHNHPSGETTPSRADVDMTERIVKTGNMLNIKIHDHLIIGKASHFSFRQKNLL